MAVSPSGKQNLMSSINEFLIANIPEGEVYDGQATTLSAGKEFFWLFEYPLSGQTFPSISISEVGLFSLAPIALERLLGFDSAGKAIKGERNQTLVEINCWARDTAEKADATKVVRELRDKVYFVLKNAGEFDEDTDSFVVPPIELKDFSQPSPPVEGKITVDRADNSIDEKYIVDADDQNIKRYKLLVRMFWFETV